jgi:Ser/Thr protein kinase RdoA (MazF antagonist)
MRYLRTDAACLTLNFRSHLDFSVCPMHNPKTIAALFPIGLVREVTQIKSGLMHSTYGVNAESGRFTLQRLHQKLSTPEIIGDYEAVTRHLYQKKLPAPCLIRTRDDRPIHVDEDGRWWRLASWVPGETPSKVQTAEQAEQGARALGRFHRVMMDFDHHFASQHPLHDTEAHLSNLRASLNDQELAGFGELVAPEIETILRALPSLLLPTTLPLRVVHGDPKISNVLFDGQSAIGLIDLDTCNRHTVLVDLGDAIRSWCRDGSEDETQHFQLDRFEAMMRGYAAEGLPLTAEERGYLSQAGPLITLELASRFARDVMQDEYFAFDSEKYPSRRAHNCARTRAMLFLAEDMQRHTLQIERLIKEYLA